jgi:hypothetical protein
MGTAKHHATVAKRMETRASHAKTPRESYLFHRAAVKHANIAASKKGRR